MAFADVLGLDDAAEGSPLSLMGAVAKGIPLRRIKSAAKFLGADETDFGVRLLGRSTFYRLKKRDGARLNPEQSATLTRIVRLQDLANRTFKNEAKAEQFMRRPHPLLNGQSPIEAGLSEFGAEAATDILRGILYSTAA